MLNLTKQLILRRLGAASVISLKEQMKKKQTVILLVKNC